MTGFAKRQSTIDGRNYIVEIKSLNSKQMDALLKLPQRIKNHELDIRSMLNRLERGKIDLIVTEELTDGTTSSLNRQAASQRYNELKEWAASVGSNITEEALLGIVLQQSDIWESNSDEEITDESRM